MQSAGDELNTAKANPQASDASLQQRSIRFTALIHFVVVVAFFAAAFFIGFA